MALSPDAHIYLSRMSRSHVALIIPALNEEQSIGLALAEIPPGLYAQILVVDNGSTDRTAAAAGAGGATVVS